MNETETTPATRETTEPQVTEQPVAAAEATASSPSSSGAEPSPASRGPSLLHLGVVVAVLGGGVLITALTSDVDEVSEPGIRVVQSTAVSADGEVVPIEQPFLPDQVGPWQGGALSGLSEAERAILPEDTQGARRLYTHQSGQQLYCSIVLAGRDVTSIHRPELCLPGQGWKIRSEYVEQLDVPSAREGRLGVMRMNTEREMTVAAGKKARVRSVFAYWFVGKDRVTPHHMERIILTTKDRVLHSTNHRWAYIMVNAVVDPTGHELGSEEPEDEAMALLAGFVKDIYPELMMN